MKEKDEVTVINEIVNRGVALKNCGSNSRGVISESVWS